MNNAGFRNLVSSNAVSPAQDDTTSSVQFKKPMALGSRARASIPMTPRSIPGMTGRNHARTEFARQVVDNSSINEPPPKRFKSSAAPKGTRLAAGYVDRTSLRRHEDGGDNAREPGDGTDKAKRLQALEEMLKLQQIDLSTFEKLRDEMGIGGDVSSTHLVKGLDWKLLRKIKQGDNIDQLDPSQGNDAKAMTSVSDEIDVDAELDKALDKETSTQARDEDQDEFNEDEQRVSNSAAQAQQVLSRNEILRRLKASRKGILNGSSQAPVAPAPVLNDKFKKVPVKPTGPTKEKFTETINGRRREVLLITNPDGSTKRKSRWIDPEASVETSTASEEQVQAKHQDQDLNLGSELTSRSFTGDSEKKNKPRTKTKTNIMGMDVPTEIAAREAARQAAEMAAQEAEEDYDDIFQGVGADYDPLADVDRDSEPEFSSSEAVEVKDASGRIAIGVDDEAVNNTSVGAVQANDAAEAGHKRKTTYFSSSVSLANETAESRSNKMMSDPTIVAALKRAAAIRRREEAAEATSGQAMRTSQNNLNGESTSLTGDTEKSRAFLQRLREQERKDAADLDLGFGGSRFADDDEDENDGEILHDIHDLGGDRGGDDDDGGKGSKGQKRKRGPKKRKGDKNDVGDVMRAMERHKK